MQGELMIYASIMFIAGLLYIATSSIAAQCINYKPTNNALYSDVYPSNAGYITSNLVSAVFITIVGMVGIYLAFKG